MGGWTELVESKKAPLPLGSNKTRHFHCIFSSLNLIVSTPHNPVPASPNTHKHFPWPPFTICLNKSRNVLKQPVNRCLSATLLVLSQGGLHIYAPYGTSKNLIPVHTVDWPGANPMTYTAAYSACLCGIQLQCTASVTHHQKVWDIIPV